MGNDFAKSSFSIGSGNWSNWWVSIWKKRTNSFQVSSLNMQRFLICRKLTMNRHFFTGKYKNWSAYYQVRYIQHIPHLLVHHPKLPALIAKGIWRFFDVLETLPRRMALAETSTALTSCGRVCRGDYCFQPPCILPAASWFRLSEDLSFSRSEGRSSIPARYHHSQWILLQTGRKNICIKLNNVQSG